MSQMIRENKLKKGALLAVLIIFIVFMPITANAKAHMNRKKATISVGQTLRLIPKGLYGKIKWSSSKKSVVHVSEYGVISGRKAGTAVIRAKANGTSVECKITVKHKPGDTFPEGEPEVGEADIILKTPAGTSEGGNIPTIYIPKRVSMTPADAEIQAEMDFSNPFWVYLDGIIVQVKTGGLFANLDVYTEDYRGIEKSGVHRVDVVQYQDANPALPVVLHRVFYYKIVRT